MPMCSAFGCNKLAVTRGWCSMHYTRWLRHGAPELTMPRGKTPVSVVDRLSSKVIAVESGCWEWTGASDDQGYGQLSIGSTADGTATNGQAYRLIYELVVGPIPEGLHLDHLCNNPPCVNPAHMEPVTQAENNHRAAERRGACLRGHPWTAESTYFRPNGSRECRICRRAGWKLRTF